MVEATRPIELATDGCTVAHGTSSHRHYKKSRGVLDRTCVTAGLILATAALLHAQYASPIITKDVTIEQKLNSLVPLDLFFRDEANQTVALRTYFGEKPVVFFPQYILGYLGMPRRYHAYPPEFQTLNVLSTAGASILGIGYLIPRVYFLWSLKYGPKAGINPWGAKGIEWQIQSPPTTFNFDETPVVTEEAYNYGPLQEIVG
jgi:hypothetical protein